MRSGGRDCCLGLLLSALFSFSCLTRPASGEETAPQLPRVVLLGDSIRLGYAPLVAKRLAGKATVVSPASNGGDSAALLRQIEQWAIRENPAVVHFNCGLHDLRLTKAIGRHQVEAAQYQANLEQLATRLRKETTAAVVFANTTPILDARRAGRNEKFSFAEADVQRYNSAAVSVMNRCGAPVNDLHWVIHARQEPPPHSQRERRRRLARRRLHAGGLRGDGPRCLLVWRSRRIDPRRTDGGLSAGETRLVQAGGRQHGEVQSVVRPLAGLVGEEEPLTSAGGMLMLCDNRQLAVILAILMVPGQCAVAFLLSTCSGRWGSGIAGRVGVH